MSSADHTHMFERLNALRAAGAGRQGQRERFNALASQIENGDDSDRHVALSEICNALNMATEDVINGMRAETLVPPIVSCLRFEHNSELMYLAARVLTYMCDSLTTSATCIIRAGGLPLLCEKLMVIQDIELAEQCIACIDKIAAEHPGPVLEAGGAMALISFVDFFNIAVQRRAVGTVAQISRRVSSKTFELVQGILPRLRQFMQSDDAKLAENAIVALSGIAAGVKNDAAASVELFGETAPLLIEIMEKHRNGPLFSAAVRFLADVTQSAAVVEMLVDLGIPSLLGDLLAGGVASTGCGTPGSFGGSPSDISGASPFNSTGGGAGGQIPSTPPRAGRPADPSAAVEQSPLGTPQSKATLARLTPEAVSDITAVLKNLLPPPQVDFLLYMDGLALIMYEAPRRRALEPRSAASGPEDDDGATGDEDEEEEDEEGQRNRASRRSMGAFQNPRHRDTLNQLLEAHGVRLDNDSRWLRCRPNVHRCDSCGKRNLSPGDWYRSNDRDDFDLCQRCLLVSVTTGSVADTFTDMASLLESAGAAGENNEDDDSAAGPAARVPIVGDKHALMKRSPYLAERIADVVGVVIDVALDTDHPATRRNCVEFVLRLAARACEGAEEAALAGRILAVPSAGAFLVALMRRTSSVALGEVAAGIFIAEQCAKICREEAMDVFAREGVLHALANLRTLAKGPSSKPSSPLQAKPPAEMPSTTATAPTATGESQLHVLTSTEAGWRTLLSERAALLVSLAATATDSPSTRALVAAINAVHTGDWAGAAFALSGALDAASSFEILNSNVTEVIVSALKDLAQRSATECLVAASLFVTTLWSVDAAGSPSPRRGAGGADAISTSMTSTTALHKLVRHCHALIGQLETFGSKQQRVQQPFRLVIAPHSDAPAVGSQPTSPTAPGSPQLPAPAAAAAPTAATTPADANAAQGARRSRRERHRHQAQSSGTGGGRTATSSQTVSIEPLATIGAVADYIATRFLNLTPAPGLRRQQGEPSGNANDDDDDVEDILPPADAKPKRAAVSDPNAPQRDAQANAAAAIVIRYGNQTLPHSMSMQQVMQQYVPQHLHSDPVHLYFKQAAAFGGDVLPLPSATSSTHTYSPTFDASALFRAAKDVTIACCRAFAVEDDAETPDAIVGLLRLLSVVHAVLKNTDSAVDCINTQPPTDQLREAIAVLRSIPPNALSKELVNSKLTNKVLRYIDGPGVVGQLLDTWCVTLALDCPFLFPTATRRLLFEVGFFGTSRAIARVLEHCKEMDRPVTSHHRTHRVSKKKVRVWRNRPLESAMALMDAHGLSRSWLDVQYYNEAGSGLGPTHEFFTLVGERLRSSSLGVWRTAEQDTLNADLIESAYGLYLQPGSESVSAAPLPTGPSAAAPASGEKLSTHGFVGRFLARSVIDQHILNLRLSPTFHRLLRGDVLVLDDVRFVAPDVYRTLYAITQARLRGAEKLDFAGNVVAVEDLSLNFVLPGRDREIELVPNGADVAVTKANAAEYVDLVAKAMLCDGVRREAVELREAFNEVLSLKSLRLFDVSELDGLFCGHQKAVSAEEWAQHTVCDHGFTSHHPTVRMLYDELGSWSFTDQTKFIQFLTGAPQLPTGGLGALKPKMTIVRKKLSDGGTLAAEMEQLPSAMTCQNYLKLPAYDKQELLAEKLRQAVQFGCGAFHFT